VITILTESVTTQFNHISYSNYNIFTGTETGINNQTRHKHFQDSHTTSSLLRHNNTESQGYFITILLIN